MPESGALVDLFRSILDAVARRRPAGVYFLVVFLVLAVHRKVLIRDIQEYALVDVSVQRPLADGNGEDLAFLVDFRKRRRGRKMPVEDLVLDVRSKLVVVSDFQVRPVYALALFVFPLRRVGAVYLAVHQLRRALDGQPALDLSIDCGIVDMKCVRDLLRFVALLQHLVDFQAIVP